MLETVLQIVGEAGDIIMDIYRRQDLQVQLKDDSSPLTQADLKSHAHITRRLAESFGYPILSEEDPVEYAQRQKWGSFWLVDPLDGTKDFVAGTNDFTVNIALIEGGAPVLGVIGVPARGLLYGAVKGQGAFKFEGSVQTRVFNARRGGELICAASRFHTSERVQEFCLKYGISQTLPFGSALKFCMVAEGAVDVYPRFGRTMEWDTAAGHCLVKEGGGKVIDIVTKQELVYNKESLANNGFIASGLRFDFV